MNLPEGTIFLHSKEQIENFSDAINTAYVMLNAAIDCGIKNDEDSLSIRVKAVTDTEFRVEVSGVTEKTEEH